MSERNKNNTTNTTPGDGIGAGSKTSRGAGQASVPGGREGVGLPGTFGIGQLGGVPLRVHGMALLMLPLLAFLLRRDLDFLLYVLAGILSLFLHEWGHAFAAKRRGYRVASVTLLPLQAAALLQEEIAPGDEFTVIAAGPVVNLLLALPLWSYLAVWGDPLLDLAPLGYIPGGVVIGHLLLVNLLMFGSNLLPFMPFDGGRLLRHFLVQRYGLRRGRELLTSVGFAGAAELFLFGLFHGALLLSFLGVLILVGTVKEVRIEETRDLLCGLRVEQVMLRDPVTVGHGDSVRQTAVRIAQSDQGFFPVLLGDQVEGWVTPAMLAHAASGDNAYVAGVMSRKIVCVSGREPASNALHRLQEFPPRPVMVIEEGRFCGIVTLASIDRWLAAQRVGNGK